MVPVVMRSALITQNVSRMSDPLIKHQLQMPAEFVMASNYDDRRPDLRRFAHKECLAVVLEECRAKQNYVKLQLVGKGEFIELQMTRYFDNISCSYCHMPLQCSCSRFKVSEPATGKCCHETTNECRATK